MIFYENRPKVCLVVAPLKTVQSQSGQRNEQCTGNHKGIWRLEKSLEFDLIDKRQCRSLYFNWLCHCLHFCSLRHSSSLPLLIPLFWPAIRLAVFYALVGKIGLLKFSHVSNYMLEVLHWLPVREPLLWFVDAR